jgi:uncharacterized phosphatase
VIGVRVTLIRHGQSVGNAQGILQGQKDFPLSAQGIQEAKKIAQWLAKEQIDLIYSSDLARAYETAQEIAKHHGVEVIRDNKLREVSFGSFEGLTQAEISKQYPEYAGQDWLSIGLEGMEQIEQVRSRALGVLHVLLEKHQGKHVYIVSHGAFISTFLMAVLQVEWKGTRAFAIGNTSMTTIDFSNPKQFVIVAVNEAPHLVQVEKEQNAKTG